MSKCLASSADTCMHGCVVEWINRYAKHKPSSRVNNYFHMYRSDRVLRQSTKQVFTN